MHEMWRNLKTHRRWLSRVGLTVTVYAHMLTHAVKFGYAKWHELGYPAHLPTCTHTHGSINMPLRVRVLGWLRGTDILEHES